MTTLYLIRHGLNDFVGKHKLAGWQPGIHLNEDGKAQAQALAKHLSHLKLKAIYASPLERTMETAAPIAAAQKLAITPREGLGEIHYGRWQGQSVKTLKRRKLWPVIQNTPSLARFPDGESFPEAQARIVAELETLRSKHKGTKDVIACVTHADPIKLAITHYIGLHLDFFQRLAILPASMSILRIDEHRARLLAMNLTLA
jgi:probable phosphomutase (TIGR03848 family)